MARYLCDAVYGRFLTARWPRPSWHNRATSSWPKMAPITCGPSALPLLRGDLLQRFERALDGNGLGQREVLANGVLGKLAARDGFEIDDVDRNLGPAEQLRGAQSA